ncbi:MAG TPA: 16S rRNA (guanine(527)-N(7))-methyltransferase RsmG [Bacteroidaceae bacterium]|nr:16S rRNA (guanine(527)-N(7))-methyltransferase RsmG [Bacteroidaceae bacterium]
MDEILKYFPELSDIQQEQFGRLGALYKEWNARINVISRKDIDNLYIHHVLHSLAIAKVYAFGEGTRIMDLGTGGGFPAIPLAIMFPKVHFHLVDRIAKKLRVCEEVSKAIGLKNITIQHNRGEDIQEQFDFVVSRGVMPMMDLFEIVQKNISKEEQNIVANGLICLKGGDLHDELARCADIVDIFSIADYFDETFFETKKVVYLPAVEALKLMPSTNPKAFMPKRIKQSVGKKRKK